MLQNSIIGWQTHVISAISILNVTFLFKKHNSYNILSLSEISYHRNETS